MTALVLLGVGSCSHSSPAVTDGATADGLTCQPSLHDTQGGHPAPEIQRYRIFGASSDGHRIAVVYSHFGPSSQDPFVNVLIYEQGATSALYHDSRFAMGAGPNETVLASEVEAAINAAATAMAQYNVVKLAAAPQPEPWCQSGSAVFLGNDAKKFTWSTSVMGCPTTTNAPTTLWKLCAEQAPGTCVTETTEQDWDCEGQQDEVNVVDTYRMNGVLWVIGEKKVTAIDPLFLWIRSAAGTSI